MTDARTIVFVLVIATVGLILVVRLAIRFWFDEKMSHTKRMLNLNGHESEDPEER